MSIQGIHSKPMETDVWLTPPEIISALGPFDLDPCAATDRPWATAETHYTEAEDGLRLPWHGRAWLNPPYGQHTARWMARLALHGTGTALIFARTETAIFFPWVWQYATAVLFIKGRLYFHRPDGSRAKNNAGAPSVLVAYGEQDATALANSGITGKFIRL